MSRSPLHTLHEELGARFTEFGGWEMPLRYDSVLAEHRAVRASVGVFDVSHLGRFELSGPGAHHAMRRLLCNDIARIGPGRCQYTMMLEPDGGIIDDLIVWWWEPGRFWVLPNAANQDRVMAAFGEEAGCEMADLRAGTAFFAVQGPDAPSVIEQVLGEAPGRFSASTARWEGEEVALAGTGYTGEPGAEVCITGEMGAGLFRSLLSAGGTPVGLGARDTLRLEAGYPLWGADIDESTTPIEAGLRFAVSLDHDFVGREPVSRQIEEGVRRRLTGLVMEGPGIPRSGHAVRTPDGGTGRVTSGNISPSLDRGIALAYISPPPDPEGAPAEVEIRERWVKAATAKPPFHES